MGSEDAAARVRGRLREWQKTQGRGALKRLSDAVNATYGVEKSQSWATGIISGEHDLRLRDLDAVATLLDKPPGELVRNYDRNYLELTMLETRLIEYFRALPDSIRQHWMRFLDFVFLPQVAEAKTRHIERVAKTAKARTREHKSARKPDGAGV